MTQIFKFECPWCSKRYEYKYQLWNHYESCTERGKGLDKK